MIKSSLDKITPSVVKVSNTKMHDLIVAYSRADTNLATGTLYQGLSMEHKIVSTEELEYAPGDSTLFSNSISILSLSCGLKV